MVLTLLTGGVGRGPSTPFGSTGGIGGTAPEGTCHSGKVIKCDPAVTTTLVFRAFWAIT